MSSSLENPYRRWTHPFAVVIVALIGFALASPGMAFFGFGSCDLEVVDFCWAMGRNIDPNTCECDMDSCFEVLEPDCTEQGMHLDTSTCSCVSDPAAVGLCAQDPYALGCPRSFDTWFGNSLRIRGGNPLIGGGSPDACSFASYSWCAHNGGLWSSYGCSCSNLPTTNSFNPQEVCGENGGTWYDPQSAAISPACYNPSGYLAESQCTTTNNSMSSCVAMQRFWNPYTCTCSVTP